MQTCFQYNERRLPNGLLGRSISFSSGWTTGNPKFVYQTMEETQQPLGPGETGIVILTNIDRTLMPVLRYNVGDRGLIIADDCTAIPVREK